MKVIEVIVGARGRRYWSAVEELYVVEESLVSGEPISAVVRRHGVAPNLPYCWRAVREDDLHMSLR